jgi:hypothetical protein
MTRYIQVIEDKVKYQNEISKLVYNEPFKYLFVNLNSYIILYYLNAVGCVYYKNNSFSINSIEFIQISTTLAASGNSLICPAKFYIGCSVEKLNSNSLLTGISTQNSPISYRVTSGTSIGTANATITLIVNFDALIEVDLINRQCSVKT